MAYAPLTLRRWKRTEYERLIHLGVFEGEPIELIAGQLVVAEPQHPYHASSISAMEYAVRASPSGRLARANAVARVARRRIGARARSRRGARPPRRLSTRAPRAARARDRSRRVWIVNLVDGVLEVCRDPVADSSAAYGWRYRSVTSLSPADLVIPLAFSSSRIAVADLLP